MRRVVVYPDRIAVEAADIELASSGQHVKVLVSADSPERLTDVHV